MDYLPLRIGGVALLSKTRLLWVLRFSVLGFAVQGLGVWGVVELGV